MKTAASSALAMQPEAYDWESIGRSPDAHGNAMLPGLLTAEQCDALAALYPREAGFRSRIVMARHGFGRGEYKYFAYPPSSPLDRLRHAPYPRLAPIARRWNRQLGIAVQYPDVLDDFLQRCHAAGQNRPTPLVLRYGEGDYNRLHQGPYGEHMFPLQATLLLSEPCRDFTGGEFVMTEQRPRMQSRPIVLPLRLGDAAVIATAERPFKGAGGHYRVNLRHGISRVRQGERIGLELSFHDAP